ncbi:hypothetical protein PISL3812_01770 [Talaromyces islandicus]|uniref:Late endosomal/lysosomal adaptor and MAPK and MTOR activator domain-containing protein n=1 Tax=Talaromyces islandicus TaxID=28573 RepID=A0A0U1LQG9_TALIS|nr:hypothetical protein PISL3812_01770 [Talaromyces islandicus]
MGACQSCLGLGRREEHEEAEHARLMDDDLYPGGFGYGSVNHPNQGQADPEDLKREREALEAICQRASDSVVDIWSSHTHLQPQATLRSHGSGTSSRVPSNETQQTTTADTITTTTTTTPSTTSTQKGTAATLKTSPRHLAPVPKNWGEVVISPRRKGKKLASQTDGSDIFGVLNVS